MAVVGYARVSSTGQSLDVQLEQLKLAGCERFFSEKRTGTSIEAREALSAALDWVRDGDVLCVTRLDRLARSVTDLRSIVDRLEAKRVGLRVLQQPIDTTTSSGRLMLNMLAAFAEFETDLRKERQADGIAKAKAKGMYRGRPASIDLARILELEAEGLGPAAIAKRLNIGRASVYRIKAQASNRSTSAPPTQPD